MTTFIDSVIIIIMKLGFLLISVLTVLLVSGCISGYTFEQGMTELESIENRYLDDSGTIITGDINTLVGELQAFKSKIDTQEGDDIEALSIFTDFKINYYNFINELEALSQASEQATCSNPLAVNELVDSAGSVRFYSDNIADNINQLILGYGIYIDNETISGMERLRVDVENSTTLLIGVVDERISMLNCSGGL